MNYLFFTFLEYKKKVIKYLKNLNIQTLEKRLKKKPTFMGVRMTK